MRRASHNARAVSDIRVVVRTPQGKYLAQDAHGLFFTDNRAEALVFNYCSDRVQDQLEMLRETHGLTLAAEPVPPEEIYETCDGCKELFMPSMTFFDGKRFLCADCRRRSTPRSTRLSAR